MLKGCCQAQLAVPCFLLVELQVCWGEAPNVWLLHSWPDPHLSALPLL